jgi:hypothetical protein
VSNNPVPQRSFLPSERTSSTRTERGQGLDFTALLWRALTAGVLLLAGAILNGIIGNRSDAAFLMAWERIGQGGFLGGFVVGILVVLLGVLTFGVVYKRRVVDPLRVDLAYLQEIGASQVVGLLTLERWIGLDDSVLRLLPNLALADDRRTALKKILLEFIIDTKSSLGDHVKGAIILEVQGDYLVPLVADGVTQDSEEECRYFIGRVHGSDRGRGRGVAGRAFVTRKLRTGNMTQNGGQRLCSDEYYVTFGGNPGPLRYRSFAAIPIMWADMDTLGVLCFDCEIEGWFDNEDVQRVLTSLSSRAAAVLMLNAAMEERHGKKD